MSSEGCARREVARMLAAERPYTVNISTTDATKVMHAHELSFQQFELIHFFRQFPVQFLAMKAYNIQTGQGPEVKGRVTSLHYRSNM